MTKKSYLATLVTLVLSGTSLQVNAEGPSANARENLEAAANSYIFVFNDSVSVQNVNANAHALAKANGGSVRLTFNNAIKGFSANMSLQAAQRLAANNPNIAYFEPNGVVWATDLTAKRGKPPKAQQTPYGISRVGGPVDGSGLTAWILDTGIDLDHPDLNVDVGRAANFVSKGKNSADDGNGHGTHVAGTVGALDNGIDVVGVAPNASVVPVRVLDNSGSGTIDGVIAGVDYVAANARSGDCANMSLGAAGHFASLHDAVENAASKGVRFAIAAGNSGQDAANEEPAHVEHSNVYTVSAIDSSDRMASWSNYGSVVDYAAPGVSILSTKKGGGTTSMSGTSMAAPHVCGLLLLGRPGSDGTAKNDPDGKPDPIAHF